MEIGWEWMDVLLCGLNWFGWMGGWVWLGCNELDKSILARDGMDGMGWDGMGWIQWMENMHIISFFTSCWWLSFLFSAVVGIQLLPFTHQPLVALGPVALGPLASFFSMRHDNES